MSCARWLYLHHPLLCSVPIIRTGVSDSNDLKKTFVSPESQGSEDQEDYLRQFSILLWQVEASEGSPPRV